MKRLGEKLLITRSAVRARPGEPSNQRLTHQRGANSELLPNILAAVPNIQWFALTLLLFTLPAFAEPATTLERNTVLQHVRSKVMLTKQASGTVVCMMAVDDVIAGEWIELRGWVRTTNNTTALIGVTFELMVWDGTGWSNLRGEPNGSELGGGNLTPQQHHWPYVTTADYTTANYAGRVWFATKIWTYRKPNPYGYLDLEGCQIRAVRHRP